MQTRMLLYVPVRASDSDHGFTESFVAPTELYGTLRIHEAEIKLTYTTGHAIPIDSVIEIDGQYYRVVGRVGNPLAPKLVVILEATTKPIVPNS